MFSCLIKLLKNIFTLYKLVATGITLDDILILNAVYDDISSNYNDLSRTNTL